MKYKTSVYRILSLAAASIISFSLSGCGIAGATSGSLSGELDPNYSLCVPWTREDFLVCDFTYLVTNNGNTPENLVAAEVFLSAGGSTYQAKPEDQWQGGSYWISQTINPGEQVMFRTSFSVPIGSKLDQMWISSSGQKLVVVQINKTTDELN